MPYEKHRSNSPAGSKPFSAPVWLRWMRGLPLLRRLRIVKRWRDRADKWASRAEYLCPELHTTKDRQDEE